MLERLEVTGTEDELYPGYEYVRALAHVAVDPAHPANAGVVDLDRVPTADGLVRGQSDVRVLRPRDGGSGRLLVVVPNRGLTMGVPLSLGTDPARMLDPVPDPGDGFLLRRGWTVAWAGWQWDVPDGEGRLGLRAPLADVDPGWLRVEFRPDADQTGHALSDSSVFLRFTDLPTVDVDDPEAVLTVRTTPHGPGTELPRESWRFPTPTSVELDGGFRAFHWYTLRYRSAHAPVGGLGLLAFRDVGAWLRRDARAAFAFGVSQSGRFLRQLLADGRAVGEDGRCVFDGVLAHVAGARRGEFDKRFGQPALTHPLTSSYGPPYDSAGLLARHRATAPAPKVFLTNSASEYWRGDGALVHADPATGADLPEDPDARAYLFGGIDHLGRFPMKDALPLANEPNPLDAAPLLRALFLRLEEWACDGVEPPASRVPRRADGTAATRADVLARFPHAARPDPAALPEQPLVDPAVPDWLLTEVEPTTVLVSAVDDDGNELAGIRLPAVQAAAAAYTGWNPRRPVSGLPDVLYEFAGSRLPLQSGRPVPDAAAVESAARAAAARLVDEGFLLPEDVQRTVAEALAQRAAVAG